MKTLAMWTVRDGLEHRLGPLRVAQASAERPARGWLRAVRDAIGLGQEDVARKLGVRRQSFAELETAEERGAVTMASLQKAAEAMGCELVYYLLPRAPFASTYGELARQHDPKFKKTGAGARPLPAEKQLPGGLSPKSKVPASSEPFCLTLSQD